MKKLVFCTICLLFSFSFEILYAQVQGNKYYKKGGYQPTYQAPPPNTPVAAAGINNDQEIVLEVNALMNVKADQYVAVFHLVQLGDSATTAERLMSNRINGFVDGLRKIGIDTSGIYVDMLSFVPVFDYQPDEHIFSRTFNEIPAGFELQKNIHIRYSQPAQLDKIIEIAVGYEIYDLVKVDYYVKDVQAIYESMREKCVQYLVAKVKSFQQLGIRMDTMYKVIADDGQAVFPGDRYAGYQAFARPSMEAVKKRFNSVDNKIKEYYKPVSSYYSPLSAENYDIVINPVILEPVVQFTYNLKVKYIVKQSFKKSEKIYYMVTPQGEIKMLDVK